MLKNFAQNVFKWHYFDQVYSRFTRDGKMAFFTSQTRPLRRETSQRRQPEVFLAVSSLPLAVTDVCRRWILSRLILISKSMIHQTMTIFEGRPPSTGKHLRHFQHCWMFCETFIWSCQATNCVILPSSRWGLCLHTSVRQVSTGSCVKVQIWG